MCRGHFLAACIGLLLGCWHNHGLSVATEPGFLDFDNLPETNFSCEGKVIGGYYADTETGCQMFHVCTIGQKGEVTDIKFLCLNGTVFDQETRVCERLDEVDCSKSESYYDLNLELYGNNAAGFGIQPENEDSLDSLCEEEDEDECKTEKPSVPSKPSPTAQVQGSRDESEEEETTTQPPLSSSTTSRRPVTSTSFPSTTPAPQILQFPSSSPETIAALLALHNAFAQSLQQHSNGKDTINHSKLTGFVESLNPAKATQEAETFEIKSGQTLPSRVPTPFPPKTQIQYSIPQTPSKSQFQNQPKPQFQSPPKPQFPNPPKTLYQSPPKSQFQSQPKPQYQSQHKSPTPVTHAPLTFPKPIHTTSERFGNVPFRHSFHINSQVTHFQEPNYHDQYSDHESQPSSQPQTEAPKQYDFSDYEDDYYDEKPHSSTITPYLLHQLKVNQLQNANQAKVPSVNHGSFVREVSTPSTKPFNVPSYRSVTTPGIAIITATSTTSSSSIKTGKPVQSAIRSFKKSPIATGFGDSSNNNTDHLQTPPQSYDDYKEGDVRSDPFYKDVPKISRNKRSIGNEMYKPNSVTSEDYMSLRTLKGKLLNSVFKQNSEAVLRAILNQYCNDKLNSSDSFLSYCSNNNYNSRISDTRLGNDWKIVIPKGNSDYLYLVKTISSSNEYQNSTSNVLLLVPLSSEFKLIRDSILDKLESEEKSVDLLKYIQDNSVNNSIHHRFKRVRRNKTEDHKYKNNKNASRLKKVLKKRIEKKLVRLKRQAQSTQSDKSVEGESINFQYENRRVRPVGRQREIVHTSRDPQRIRKVVRVRPNSTTVYPDETQSQVRQRRPSQRRQPSHPQPVEQAPLASDVKTEKASSSVEYDNSKYSSNTPSQVRNDKSLTAPSAGRRKQGARYHFSEGPRFSGSASEAAESPETSEDKDVEVSTTYPFNLKPGTTFSCDDKIKGGYYADVEAECYGYFICSQGAVDGPLLKSHFWCGPTTKFNQRSRTCQAEANVACSVSHRYFHLNKDILSLPDPEDNVRDTFEPSKVTS